MTLIDEAQSQARSVQQGEHGHRRSQEGAGQRAGEAQQEPNVGHGERVASVTAGSVLAALGLSRRSLPGLLVAGVGAAFIHRGVTGHCGAFAKMGVNTARPQDGQQAAREITERGIHVEQAFLINRSPEDLYKEWRDFEKLPRIMTHLKSVKVLDERRSHWVASAPRIAGGQIEWDAEITLDEPNAAIGWRSLPGSGVDTVGQVRFTKAMGDRGTELHVYMEYIPPAGRLGHWIATLFGEAPRRQMREDLRSFKRLMELGEVPTVIGQSKGTCTGRGERTTE